MARKLKEGSKAEEATETPAFEAKEDSIVAKRQTPPAPPHKGAHDHKLLGG